MRRHIEVAGRREPGTTTVEVTSTASGNLEIVIVADDMPLLVEAVLATVESWALTVGGIDQPGDAGRPRRRRRTDRGR